MRIAILVYGLDRPLSGISRYTVELARALAALPEGPEVRLLAAGGVGPLAEATPFPSIPLLGCSRLPGLVTLGNVLIPRKAHNLHVDIVHDPTGVTPFLFGVGGARMVVTIHDVFAWSCPGHSALPDTLIYRYWLPRVLPRVNAVITVSQVSKTDIVNYLRIPDDKVHVIYEGVDASYHPIPWEETGQMTSRYGLPRGYILFVGSVEERKNLRRLLQAYALLCERGEQRRLVVVGPHKWKYTRILQTVAELGIGQRVIFTGYIPDEDLPALYSGADLFVFPSLYEGFGLPPLEAMACGTPVVCSNAGSLPEVVGDAALLVDPYDVEALAEAMHRVLHDPALCEELRQKGLARAQQFTWEKAALETLAVYEGVLG
nr:glycosyltransferase family 4 protein [Chloroflexota bacterium]